MRDKRPKVLALSAAKKDGDGNAFDEEEQSARSKSGEITAVASKRSEGERHAYDHGFCLP